MASAATVAKFPICSMLQKVARTESHPGPLGTCLRTGLSLFHKTHEPLCALSAPHSPASLRAGYSSRTLCTAAGTEAWSPPEWEHPPLKQAWGALASFPGPSLQIEKIALGSCQAASWGVPEVPCPKHQDLLWCLFFWSPESVVWFTMQHSLNKEYGRKHTQKPSLQPPQLLWTLWITSRCMARRREDGESRSPLAIPYPQHMAN